MPTEKPLATFMLAGMLATAATTAATTAWAGTPDGTGFPDSMTESGHTLRLNGIGRRVFAMVVDGYASGLYLEQPAHTADQVLAEPGPKLLYTRFLHAASEDQIRGEYRAIHARYCGTHACSAASGATFNQVLAAVQPVKVGDTATYLIDNGTLTLSMNGRTILTVHDPDYAGGMLDSLLGAASPTAAYRRGLLGNG